MDLHRPHERGEGEDLGGHAVATLLRTDANGVEDDIDANAFEGHQVALDGDLVRRVDLRSPHAPDGGPKRIREGVDAALVSTGEEEIRSLAGAGLRDGTTDVAGGGEDDDVLALEQHDDLRRQKRAGHEDRMAGSVLSSRTSKLARLAVWAARHAIRSVAVSR